ncbi:MAG: helix-turn-helix domain-containing protein [Lachnospira pectinoschiza]
MISYKKLFLLMEEQEITKEKLKNKIGISSATMAKLSKNEDVSMSTIQSLCDFFDWRCYSYMKKWANILFQLRENGNETKGVYIIRRIRIT